MPGLVATRDVFEMSRPRPAPRYHRSRFAERRKRATSCRIERVESSPGGEEDPSVRPAVGPIDDSAIHMRLALAIREGVETPQQRAVVGADRDHRERGRGRVQHAINHYGSRLDLAVGRSVTGVVGPNYAETTNVLASDLVERGVAARSGITAAHAPVARRNRKTRTAVMQAEADRVQRMRGVVRDVRPLCLHLLHRRRQLERQPPLRLATPVNTSSSAASLTPKLPISALARSLSEVRIAGRSR